MNHILDIHLYTQSDASASRQHAWHIAQLFGFDRRDQTRLATAVSELARNATHGTHPGQVTFSVCAQGLRSKLVIDIVSRSWRLPGAGESDGAGRVAYHAGVNAAQHFTDETVIDEKDGVLAIRLSKLQPAATPALDALTIIDALGRFGGASGNMALALEQHRNRELAAENGSVTSHNSQLQVQADSLVWADQRKDAFLAVLAHELRGPLSAITMAADVLTRHPDDQEKAHHLGQMIARQAAHMSRIVEDLLDVSRIVRNQISIASERLDLRDVVHAAVEQLAGAAQQRGHCVQVDLPPAPAHVQGDRVRLIQVLGNLIGNAVRYTPEGGRITVELAPGDDSSQWRLRVADNGIGISAELLPRLFDLFTQAERSSDSRNSGLGLGLALVKTLVEAHGGTVTALSGGAGQGSCFDVLLPVHAH